MKNKLFLTMLILCCFLLRINAQKNKHKSLTFSIGKPSIGDAWLLEKNSLIELGFKNTFSGDFAYEAFVNRTYSDATKAVFNNNGALIEYLNDTNQSVFFWDKIETYALGVKGHFFFINKPRTEFSFFTGFGLYVSRSVLQSYKSINYDQMGGVSAIDTELEKETVTSPFVMPGLAFRYWIWERIALGVNAIAFFEIHNKQVFTEPVQANFYSLALNISYKL